MNGSSIETALERIESALSRLEKAAVRIAESDAELRDRHDRLKSIVTEAIGELDDLIEGHGG